MDGIRIKTGLAGVDRAFVAAALPVGDFRRILIKPNWVLHASNPDFPIEALVTSADLIGAAIDASPRFV